ncbi:MAG: VIT1/CCC1 transporter family protein [Spirochaetales bacterium]|nr:VIT1/CCC1 transporter family protein [Spirochaetales bacterium]
MDQKLSAYLIQNQRDEITGYHIYHRLAKRIRDPHNAEILRKIAENEMEHYQTLKTYTGRDVKPSWFTILLYTFMGRLLGLTFSLKLMERGEDAAQRNYEKLGQGVSEVQRIIDEEEIHEKELLGMVNEESLNYIGSVVLGLNDALVELTGAMAGFTLAIQKSRTIALMGLITGIAATFSMAASEFLSQRQEGNKEEAAKSSLYTGAAYIGTVVLLVLPYFLIHNPFIALAVMMGIAILIILVFNFYISVARDLPFRKRFLEMAFISLGVAALSFGIGWLVRTFWGLEI